MHVRTLPHYYTAAESAALRSMVLWAECSVIMPYKNELKLLVISRHGGTGINISGLDPFWTPLCSTAL
jgi:hypothetical protein